MSESLLFEKLPEETLKAYEAFVVFSDLPPDQRSVAAAYRLKTGRGAAKQAPGYWFGWHKDYNWESRASAKDNWKRQQNLVAQAEQIKSKRLDELEAERVRSLQAANSLFATGVKALAIARDKIEALEISSLRPNHVALYIQAVAGAFKTASELSDRALHIEQLTEALKDKLGE